MSSDTVLSPVELCRREVADALDSMNQLPCRVDEMTEREYKIFEIASELCGTLKNVQRELEPVEDLTKMLRQLCEDHIQVAAMYERGGNVSGARQLRAVGNMLGVIVQGGNPMTVLPKPEK